MKRNRQNFFAMGLLLLTFTLATEGEASERNIWLFSQDYEEYWQELEGREGLDEDLLPFDEIDKVQDAPTQPKLERSERTPLQEKIERRAKIAQSHLLKLLDQMLVASYDPQSDRASDEFLSTVKEIVKLVFYAETEKAFYERLYLVNQAWFSYPEEIEKFSVLDEALRDRALEIEAFQRGIREAIIIGSTWAGAAVGGFLVYRFSSSAMALNSNMNFWQKALRLSTKITFIGLGAWIGSYVGQTIGFLGSDLLFRSYEYSDPIDLKYPEDLKEYLDVIDEL